MFSKGHVADKAKLFSEKSKSDMLYCDKCGKMLMRNAPDHIFFEGQAYHKSDFRCSVCKTHMPSSQAGICNGRLYCLNHHPFRDPTKLREDIDNRHRIRSASTSKDDHAVIKAKAQLKNAPIPTLWRDPSSNGNLTKISSKNSITSTHDISKSTNMASIEIKLENEHGSHVSLHKVPPNPSQLKTVIQKANESEESLVLISKYFVEHNDFWYELDSTHAKPKIHKPPILIMGDEESYYTEYGREHMRHFTSLGISPYMQYDMEWVDIVCLHYRYSLKNQQHTNYVALIEEGPVLITFSTDGIDDSQDFLSKSNHNINQKYKVLMRWKGGLEWRLAFNESDFRDRTGMKTHVGKRKMISYLHPALLPSKLIKIDNDAIKDEICKLDELRITYEYKFGFIVVKQNQTTEEAIFANKHGDAQYDRLCTLLADKIELHGFTGFCGGLDNKNGRTGMHSLYTKFTDYEIMFHACTMIPFDQADPQQIQRKRHIGNDIVCLVYLEKDAKFDPTIIASKFLHVFITIQWSPKGWKVAVAANKHIPYFGPALPVVLSDDQIRDFLLTKLINAENASYHSIVFRNLETRTKDMILKDIGERYAEEAQELKKRGSNRLKVFNPLKRKPSNDKR